MATKQKGPTKAEKAKLAEQARLKAEEEARQAELQARQAKEAAELKEREEVLQAIGVAREDFAIEESAVQDAMRNGALRLHAATLRDRERLQWESYARGQRSVEGELKVIDADVRALCANVETAKQCAAQLLGHLSTLGLMNEGVKRELERSKRIGAYADMGATGLRLLLLKRMHARVSDTLTNLLVQYVDKFWPSTSTESFQYYAQVAETRTHFALWANTTKSVRRGLVVSGAEDGAGNGSSMSGSGPLSLQVSIPRSLALEPVAVRALVTEVEPEYASTRGGVFVAGGFLLRLDLCAIPSFPKTVDQWTIRELHDSLLPIAFPPRPTGSAAASSTVQQAATASSDAPETSTPDEQAGAEAQQRDPNHQYSVTLNLPHLGLPEAAPLTLQDNVTVMMWNVAECDWDPQDIGSVRLDLGAGTVSFTTARYGTFALVKKLEDRPFAGGWALSASATGESPSLALRAGRFEFSAGASGLEFGVADDNESGESGPRAAASADSLVAQLHAAGINVEAPATLADLPDGFLPKHPLHETQMIAALAFAAAENPRVRFASHEANLQLGTGELLCRVTGPAMDADGNATETSFDIAYLPVPGDNNNVDNDLHFAAVVGSVETVSPLETKCHIDTSKPIRGTILALVSDLFPVSDRNDQNPLETADAANNMRLVMETIKIFSFF